ncbi:cytochrome P450 [Streptomyces sp. SCA3-4]|uniref:cytochrome P450 n=1 Tax=Streptomyces sichuanensis TaxID=2871810 RepID=UPI001CE31B7B|nr:cytochrome P450 [Streptomyces sichuanensis]MCA6091850.1 cytochrome P450 [Streptomyces sichuanensis]
MTTTSLPASLVPAPRAPGALPGVGHLRQLLVDPTRFLTRLPSYGDLVEIRLGPRPTYVVCSPELVSEILVRRHRDFDKGGPFFDNISVFFGDGLATCPNAKHTRLRRLTQPAFHPGKLPGYAEQAGRETTTVTRGWREGQVLDVRRLMQELAMRITVSTMLASWFDDTGADAGAVRRTLGDVDVLVSGAFLRMVAPGLARLPLPTNRRYAQARDSLYAHIDATVAAYRRAGTDQGDLLSMFLAEDGDGNALSDTEVREQVMTMFIAGISTTAAMLAWTLYYLSLDDDLDAAVAAEAQKVCGGGPARHEQLPRLTTLTAVVTEAFRIRPSAWLFSRTAVTDTSLGPYRVADGADVLISPYIIHHRPDLFPEPDRFDPGRWTGDGRSWAKAERAMAMVPFGAGSRKCIGHDFTVMNVVLPLATVLADWKLTPATSRPVSLIGRSIIEPRNLKLRLHRRQVS